MDPRWVLTSDQKKVRFRNYLKKKVVVEHHGSRNTTQNNPITENHHHNIYQHHPSTATQLKLDSAIVSIYLVVTKAAQISLKPLNYWHPVSSHLNHSAFWVKKVHLPFMCNLQLFCNRGTRVQSIHTKDENNSFLKVGFFI